MKSIWRIIQYASSYQQLGLTGSEVQRLFMDVQLPGWVVKQGSGTSQAHVKSIKEKAIFQRIKFIVVLYSCDTVTEMRLANLL